MIRLEQPLPNDLLHENITPLPVWMTFGTKGLWRARYPLNPEINAWCVENLSGRWEAYMEQAEDVRGRRSNFVAAVYFGCITDAFFFKVRWL